MAGDDVRRLDEELAAGQITADEYRRRRDEIANDGGAMEAPSNSDTGAGAAAGASPFPPAFRWETAPPSDQGLPPNETTQVMPPVNRGRDAEPDPAASTQVVRAHGGRPDGDSERTQVVPAGVPEPPGPPNYQGPPQNRPPMPQQVFPHHPGGPGGGGYQGQNRPGPWNQPPADSSPPWGSSDLPPPQSGSSWAVQGPESFEADRKPSNTGRTIAIVAVVVVLLAVAIGSYLIWGRGGGDEPSPGPDTSAAAPQTTTPDREPADPLAPADIGGAEEPKGVETFDDLAGVGFLTPGELEILQRNGSGDSRLLITNFDEGKATVLVTQMGSPEQAALARDEMADLLLTFGFVEAPGDPGVRMMELLERDEGDPLIRSVYVSDDVLVRVEMIGESAQSVTDRYADVIDQQLESRPADD